uniref:Uncharacterized protein n=1 Tax=Lotus japonicus TaxID=34305 RepID=I3S6G3_LOTJA|nr:unknown [Lotus japonicus]
MDIFRQSRTHTSCNSSKFRDSSIQRHLTTFETSSNTRTRPRFLTPHSKTATSSLPS